MTKPKPLSPEEEAELRKAHGMEFRWNFNQRARFLATLDAARAEVKRLAEVHNLTLAAMDREPDTTALREALEWVAKAREANQQGRGTGTSAALMEAERTLRAALATQPSPEPLDAAWIERLAQAVSEAVASSRSVPNGWPDFKEWLIPTIEAFHAKRREYARLAAEKPEVDRDA